MSEPTKSFDDAVKEQADRYNLSETVVSVAAKEELATILGRRIAESVLADEVKPPEPEELIV